MAGSFASSSSTGPISIGSSRDGSSLDPGDRAPLRWGSSPRRPAIGQEEKSDGLVVQAARQSHLVGEVPRPWPPGARERGHGRRSGGKAVLENSRGSGGRRIAAPAAAGSGPLRGGGGGFAGALRGHGDAGSQGVPPAGQASRPLLWRPVRRHDRAARSGCL